VAEGLQIGDYRVLRELGRGGAGVVYEVVAAGSERRLALKLLHSGHTPPATLIRFGREAQLLAQVRHPSVVRVVDLKRTADGDPYIVTDFVPGEELAKVARGRPLPWERSARIVRELADALAQVHAKGIVHRDLKPQNVILHEEGYPVLLDFGLARDDAGAAERLTQTGAFLGTPAYSAPEQAEGASEVGPAADVYGLGAILYFLLSGHPPYTGSLVAILSKLVQGTPPAWPSEDDPSVPPALEAVCKRAMRADPAERTPSAVALRDELDAYLAGEETVEDRRSATWVLAGVGTLLFCAALALGLWSWRSGSEPEAEAPVAPVEPIGAVEPVEPVETVRTGPPSESLAREAENFATLAEARRVIPTRGERDLELLRAVHYRNATRALASCTHLSGIRSQREGRLLPPRALFTDRGRRLLTTGGRRDGEAQAYQAGTPLLWNVNNPSQPPKELDSIVAGAITTNVAMRLPGDPDSIVLVQSVQGFLPYHTDIAEFDGNEVSLNAYSGGLIDAGWERGHDKPATVCCVRGDDKEFAIGTGIRGSVFKDKNVVLRVPFPQGVKPGRKTRPPPPVYETLDLGGGPVRDLAYGRGGALWILGVRRLYRWEGDAVHGPLALPYASWTLAVDAEGRCVVGGKGGLTVVGPDGELLATHALPDFASVDGLAVVEGGSLLAVGTSTTGGGCWALLRPQGAQPPVVLASQATRGPYATVAVSERARRACFMRWDGEFELWDLDALLPWDPEGERVEAEVAEAPRAPLAADDLETARARAAEFSSLRRVQRGVPKEDPLKAAIRAQVVARNVEQPMWTGQHAEVLPDRGPPWPRGVFLLSAEQPALDYHLVTYGGWVADPAGGPDRVATLRSWTAGDVSSDPWSPQAGEPCPPVWACLPDPRRRVDGLLLRDLGSEPFRLTDGGRVAQPYAGDQVALRASWPEGDRRRLEESSKAVALAGFDALGNELVLAAGVGGEPAGVHVLRVPLNPSNLLLRGAGSWQKGFKPGEARLERFPLESDPRAFAWDHETALCVLGERRLARWGEGRPQLVAEAEEGQVWYAMQPIQRGTLLLVGGSGGLTRIPPRGQRDFPVEQDVLAEVRGLLVLHLDGGGVLRAPHVLAVGADAEGHAVWAALRIDSRAVTVLARYSDPQAPPYVDVAASPEQNLACLMRADGSFEVWDLQAIRQRALIEPR